MATQRPAPVFLDLFRIRFPVGALTSIAHRLSGVVLFLTFPFMIYLLELSLQGPAGFDRAIEYLQPCWIRLGSAAIAWSLFHHLFSGVRFLLIDTGTGVTLRQARRSAWTVNIAGILMALAWLGWVL